jgi:hypothetical protein
MGGSSSSSGGSSDISSLKQRDKAMAAATNRAKEQQESWSNRATKSRDVAFDQGGTRGRESPAYKQHSGSGAYAEVDRNVNIARDLEQKAKGSQINVPIPTVGTVVMNTISSMNYNNQAKALRGGGRAVYDSKGRGYDPMFPNQNYVGVVHQNALGHTVYSGRQGFSPIGRTDAQYNAETGTYTTSKMQQDSSSESSNNTPTNTQVAVKNRTDSTTSLDPKAKRSLLASSQGGTNTRYFIS